MIFNNKEFCIKKITIYNSSHVFSSIEFTKGLNIICGASNTGKTIILNAIKFILGGDPSFSKELVSSVSMELVLGIKHILLSRNNGKNFIDVTIDNNYGTEFNSRYNAKNDKPVIHELFIEYFGCDGCPMIISNSDNSRKHFTIPTILNTFYINENTINSNDSILLAKYNRISQIYLLSSLLFLITGDTFPNVLPKDSNKISDAKKDAISSFICKRIDDLTNELKTYQEDLSVFNNTDVELLLNEQLDLFEKLNSTLDDEREKFKKNLEEYTSMKSNYEELTLLLFTRKNLLSQYKSDINRLSFIATGNAVMSKHKSNRKKCPFCDSPVLINDNLNYKQAAQKELENILVQYKGLEQNILDIKNNLSKINSKLSTLKQEQEKIIKNIEHTLTPSIEQIKKDIKIYQNYMALIQKSKTLESLILNLSTSLDNEITQIDSTNKVIESFTPKEHFPNDFTTEMTDIAKNILNACNYPDVESVYFDMNSFDLVINNKEKKNNLGKGYRAALNTILALTFKEYMTLKAKYNFPLLIIDSPHNGLDEGTQDFNSVKHGLYEYLINHYNNAKEQIIVVENKINLPNIQFDKYGINIIEYTNGKYKSDFKKNRHNLYK